jgi:hypothetical protein
LPATTITNLVSEFGNPYYVKIDIEFMDEIILKQLFKANIYPPFISAESHSINIFATLLTLGGYQAFNMVDGPTVSIKYKNCLISHLQGRQERFRFEEGSAGPFGEVITDPWMTADNFLN